VRLNNALTRQFRRSFYIAALAQPQAATASQERLTIRIWHFAPQKQRDRRRKETATHPDLFTAASEP
jgi:hypothetical protein